MQHALGEQTFWSNFQKNPADLIEAFIKASPKGAEINLIRRERAK
jgi:hypothetical protein